MNVATPVRRLLVRSVMGRRRFSSELSKHSAAPPLRVKLHRAQGPHNTFLRLDFKCSAQWSDLAIRAQGLKLSGPTGRHRSGSKSSASLRPEWAPKRSHPKAVPPSMIPASTRVGGDPRGPPSPGGYAFAALDPPSAVRRNASAWSSRCSRSASSSGFNSSPSRVSETASAIWR